ncbi:hypothetical protein HCN51_16415 [Nonomuraea sp. FMUSA5-5]|uniref:PH domain-containing protein n=1 Tax=Nonomuraea composti TaxID=2720023 RepID=A0ABX1B5I5_9ACTN|nr:hypothetical protein [Nonomuraea sp. FMUSA5-5]NJP91021.1 hypothetical protein [Nonomuraea sp. FMUSA5-5]
MSDDTIVRWENGEPPGCLSMPCGCLPFGIMLITALHSFFSVPLYPHGQIIFASMVALGIVLGLLIDRYTVTGMDFTRHEMRLVSKTAVRTVEAANLWSVTVTHSGHTDAGYTRTSLEVVWRDGRETVLGAHDPDLAASLRRLLPPRVNVQDIWNKLENPPPDA